MSTTIKVAGWLLFTVMNNGTISTANFPTEPLCKDGASIIMYGETVAEKAANEMKLEAQSLVDQAFWERDHPPTYRSPTNDFEKDHIARAKKEGQELGMSWACGSECIGTFAMPDGRIKVSITPGQTPTAWSGTLRTAQSARCFPVPATNEEPK